VFSSWKGWPGRYFRVLSKPPLIWWVQAVGPVIFGLSALRFRAELLDHDTTATWIAVGVALGGVGSLVILIIGAMRTREGDGPPHRTAPERGSSNPAVRALRYAEHHPGSFHRGRAGSCRRSGRLGAGLQRPPPALILPTGDPPTPGSTLEALAEYGRTYLTLGW